MNRTSIHPLIMLTKWHRQACFLLMLLVWLISNASSYAQWQQAVSNTTQALNDISYDGSQWVAVGAGGTILNSSNGVTWTTVPSGITEDLYGVAYANGQWVAVGHDVDYVGGVILTSSNGFTWTKASIPVNKGLRAVGYGGGQWIAVGFYGTTLLSPDGATWMAIDAGSHSQSLFSIAYGGGQWITAGATDSSPFVDSPIRTSPDGITWTFRDVLALRSGRICKCEYEYLFDVSYGGNQWVVVGTGGDLAISTDGINWITHYVGYWLYGVIYGGDRWVAVGSSGTILTSTDNGTTWAKSPSGVNNTLNDVSYGAGLWVAVGDKGTIVYSSSPPMPVSLITFEGKAEDRTAHLTWKTAWEKGASHFLIERSEDAKSFEAIGRVEAQGNTSQQQTYDFLDKELKAGLWYYRLRQVDLDGTFNHSSIITVRIGDNPLEVVSLFPNPGAGPVTLEDNNGITAVTIHSVTGMVMKQQIFKQAVNRWTWEPGQLAAGTYLIQVQSQDGKSRTLRWVKQ